MKKFPKTESDLFQLAWLQTEDDGTLRHCHKYSQRDVYAKLETNMTTTLIRKRQDLKKPKMGKAALSDEDIRDCLRQAFFWLFSEYQIDHPSYSLAWLRKMDNGNSRLVFQYTPDIVFARLDGHMIVALAEKREKIKKPKIGKQIITDEDVLACLHEAFCRLLSEYQKDTIPFA